MSYEFNPDSQVFEFPNPYKVENQAMIAAGVVLLIAGGVTLINLRAELAQGLTGAKISVLVLTIALLILGIGLMARAFSHLKYFFGRDRPENLAPIIAQDRDGDSNYANIYKETMRQNAISYPEPQGALNGLLYSSLPNLIFAPVVIQRAAQVQFYNFLSLAATLLSFLVCWFLFGNEHTNTWIGLGYGAFTFFQIMRPMLSKSANNVASTNGKASAAINNSAHVGMQGVIVLILFSVLGPVLLGLAGKNLPDLTHLNISAMNSIVLFALVCAILGCAAFGLALKNQLRIAPQAVGSARVAETVTMNAHPNKLLEELDRILMERWFNRIPNRRYTHRSPEVNGMQGKFNAEIFEESQPRPQSTSSATSISHALSAPQFFWLTCLTGLAALFIVIGALAIAMACRQIMGHTDFFTTLAFGISQIAVGLFCFAASHILWGRFDFVSELIWVEMSGSYESAKLNMGNQISGNVQTSKNVINIESMTMRVWVSEIDSVIFGKDSARQLIGMRGLNSTAEELASNLKSFGETRSMVVAPSSQQDAQRAQQVGAINQIMGGNIDNTNNPSSQSTAKATEKMIPLSAANSAENSAAMAATIEVTTNIETPETSLDEPEMIFSEEPTNNTENIASTNLLAFCQGCGSQAMAAAFFCSKCGKSLST